MRDTFIRCICEFMERGDKCGLCYLLDRADIILTKYTPPNLSMLTQRAQELNSDVMTVEVDAHAIIYQINDAALRKIGKTREEAVGTCAFEFMDLRARLRSKAMLAQVVATQQPVQASGFEDGHWFHSLYVPIDGQGRNGGLYMILRKEVVPEREFVEVLPNGERVKL